LEIVDDLLSRVRACTKEHEFFKYLNEDMPGVAVEIAKSTHATARILENLTRYPSIIVRHEVAKNPQTSQVTLERLSEDKDMLVRDYARRTLISLGHLPK